MKLKRLLLGGLLIPVLVLTGCGAPGGRAGGGHAAAWDLSRVRWENYTGLPSDQVYALAVDADGRLWVGTDEGCFRFDGAGWESIASGWEDVVDIALDGAGRAWLATSDGVSAFDGETWVTYTVEDGLIHGDARALAVAEDGVWVGTWNGLSHLVFEEREE